MFSPSNQFECRWAASRWLLAAYCVAQLAALVALALIDWSPIASVLGAGLCALHGAWTLPRHISLSHPGAWRGLRLDSSGWQLWSESGGWQVVQLRPDSVALPWLVVLRFRQPGQFWTRSLCIPSDGLAADAHRRLRLRLKFSRSRWAAGE